MDISAGTTQTQQAARFPDGVPAVSEESQTAWMEYVYEQQPLPTDATGVTVTLSAVDPNGNFVNIGQATSDAKGIFALTYTPEVSGMYRIYASFGGSASYWPSSAENVMSVVNAPAASPTTTPAQDSMADLYFVPGIIAVIVTIIVVGAVILLAQRKRP